MGARRYDGLGEWYDAEVRTGPAAVVSSLARRTATDLLGAGWGRCVDVGCGTGTALRPMTGLGWKVVGVAASFGQTTIAKRASASVVVCADALRLPFGSGTVDVAVSILAHT